MANTKNINYFSVDSVDLREVAGTESRIFNNDDISIILNGSPSESPFLHEGQLYQLPEPRLLIVTAGEADVHLDLEQCHFAQGTVVVTTPDMMLEFKRCSSDAMLCGLVVKGGQLHIDECMVVSTSPRDYAQLLRMLHLVWDIASAMPFRRDTVNQMVATMVSNIRHIKQESERQEPAASPSRSQQLFQQFKTLVSRHAHRERSIPFYAEQLCVTPHHLSAVVSRASGHSVMYWVNRAAILRARVLLNTTDLMTYQIAERLNFPNAPAFSHFFKRETGMTPKKYREETNKRYV